MSESIRRSFWEDYVRQVAKSIAVENVWVPTDICVNRAVDLAEKVEEAIRRKFPDRPASVPPDPLSPTERYRQ